MERAQKVVLGLAAFQAVDAVACAIPLGYIKRDLDHIGCPPKLQRALPVIKAASAVGLAAGLKSPKLGKLTAGCLVGYFTCAIGFHVRAKDNPLRSLPAAAVGATAVAAGRAYASRALAPAA